MSEEAKKQIIAQGPCAFCGGPYAAHRTIDAQMGRVSAGDDIASVAEDYSTTVPAMVASWSALTELLHDEALLRDGKIAWKPESDGERAILEALTRHIANYAQAKGAIRFLKARGWLRDEALRHG